MTTEPSKICFKVADACNPANLNSSGRFVSDFAPPPFQLGYALGEETKAHPLTHGVMVFMERERAMWFVGTHSVKVRRCSSMRPVILLCSYTGEPRDLSLACVWDLLVPGRVAAPPLDNLERAIEYHRSSSFFHNGRFPEGTYGVDSVTPLEIIWP